MKVEHFFRDVVEQNEQALYEYFTPDAQILWHCTNECFTAQEFIRANCEYPGIPCVLAKCLRTLSLY